MELSKLSGLILSLSTMFTCLSAAKVAELVDAPDLGSGTERYGGSSPPFRTKEFRESAGVDRVWTFSRVKKEKADSH